MTIQRAKCVVPNAAGRVTMIDELTSEELAVANEVTRSILVLADGYAPERRAAIATYAAAQVIGVTMAVESYPVRRIDGTRLDNRTNAQFSAIKARCYIHATDQAVNGKSAGEIVIAWADSHLDAEYAALVRPLPHEGKIG